MNQSINQWISQWISQSINQSINQSVCQSVSQSISQSVNQSISQSVNQSISQSINQSINLLNLSYLFTNRKSKRVKTLSISNGQSYCHWTGTLNKVSNVIFSKYLISRFFFMIAHTRQFPTTPNTTNMESTVVITTPADPVMMERHLTWIKTKQQFVN